MPSVEIKDYNVMIDGQKCFDQPLKNNIITYDNILKITAGQGNDYTTSSLLFYAYFNEQCKVSAVDLSKQQAFHADPKAIQQINFTGNLERAGNTAMFFIIGEAK